MVATAQHCRDQHGALTPTAVDSGRAGAGCVIAAVVSGEGVYCLRLKPPAPDDAGAAGEGGGAELITETQLGGAIACWDFSRSASKGMVRTSF